MTLKSSTKRQLTRLRKARWPLASPVGRMRILLLLIAVVFSLCAGRALQIQAFDAQAYAAEAADQMQQSQVLPAQRGDIVDRYGDVLAYTENTVKVIADPKMILTNGKMNRQPLTERDQAIVATAPQRIADLLAKYLGGTAADYLPKLSNPKSAWQVIKTRVPAETFAELQAEMSAAGLIGLSRVTAPTRRYPNGTVASNLIGWVNEEGNAAGGLELSLEKLLKGTDGKEVYDSSPNGKIPLGDNVLIPAQNGHNFGLTIDLGMQLLAEQRLQKALADTGAQAAAVIVMDPRTGEVLTMANGPSFDSNDPGKGDLENMGNRATNNVYEPGSVQKILTFAALLDSGTITPDDKVKIPGFIKQDQFKITDWWNHGNITMRARGIFAKSSNVGTITMARTIGKQQLHDYYASFGLGQRTNIGVGGEAAGYLPKATMPDYTRDGISFGTSLSVTALQNATAVSSVINGGDLPRTDGDLDDGRPGVQPGQPELHAAPGGLGGDLGAGAVADGAAGAVPDQCIVQDQRVPDRHQDRHRPAGQCRLQVLPGRVGGLHHRGGADRQPAGAGLRGGLESQVQRGVRKRCRRPDHARRAGAGAAPLRGGAVDQQGRQAPPRVIG